MTELTAEQLHHVESRYGDILKPKGGSRFYPILAALVVFAYCAYVWAFFDINRVIQRADWGIAGNYLADWIAYEVRPDFDLAENHIEVSYPRFSALGSDPQPEWVSLERAVVDVKIDADLTNSTSSTAAQSTGFMANAPTIQEQPSSSFSFMAPDAPTGNADEQGNASSDAPSFERSEHVVNASIQIGDAMIWVTPEYVEVSRGDQLLAVEIVLNQSVNPMGQLPDWATQKVEGGEIRLDLGFAGRVEIEDDAVKVRRRFIGWENFLFDTRSAFWGLTLPQVGSLIMSDEKLDENKANWQVALDDIVNNAEWQHGDVWIKLLQTIVMAFMGTLLATLVAFPLAFFAARNINPNRVANQVLKRAFDFLRSVDMLIWALVFTRTFGPGPLAGISAIFFTDTGTFGKLYSEALENVDDKQREGVKSVGAANVLVQRFGVIPQVLPVFLSQSLYFWESNTRSATIIGAVGAGGIGLKLWEAMRTNQDWENVAYMVVLILIVVFIFDNISNYLRKKLI